MGSSLRMRRGFPKEPVGRRWVQKVVEGGDGWGDLTDGWTGRGSESTSDTKEVTARNVCDERDGGTPSRDEGGVDHFRTSRKSMFDSRSGTPQAITNEG